MKHTKFKSAFGIGLASLLAIGATTTVHSNDVSGDHLSTDQIFKNAQARYTSLASYSDQGQIVTTVNDTSTTASFVIQLARPFFYLVEWEQNSESEFATQNTSPQAVWSSGAGNFLETGYGPENEGSLNVALDEASVYSGGASAIVPMIFFNTESGNDFGRWVFEEHRQPDETVGMADCYVFTRESQGRTKTLWIGKQDFLIHQVRTLISAEAMQAAMAEVAGARPQTIAFAHDFISTEIHTNIVLNKQFSRSDVVPSIEHFARADDNDN
jgi:hypothetical protein